MDERVEKYNQPGFIEMDPISIPHQFSRKEDIEISGLFAAILAWGQRKTIISKCLDLLRRMDDAPFQFVIGHQEQDLRKLKGFCHRTFNETDLLFFIHFLKQVYQTGTSLEMAFFEDLVPHGNQVENGLNQFRKRFTGDPFFPKRTGKHIASPAQKSACKRLNMFLRWMVRKDEKGVDFGIWKSISPAQLVCPCDVHVERTARLLGLIQRKGMDWQTALELTANLRELNPNDPVKYDFALFGLGEEGYFL